MWAGVAALAGAALLAQVHAQPFQPDSGIAPLGSLRTSDYDGPYNITMLSAQANECRAGAAARGYKGGISDKDIIDFLVNVECLEGLFDTWGVFGQGFIGDLEMGGPTPKGARAADLSEEVRTKLAEVALNEQGHALLTRQAGGANPCPEIDFDKGFNDILAAAYKLKGSVKKKYGAPFDPFKNDQNFIMSMLTLEELGATGNKGLIGIMTNPVLANAIAGLATSATAQATIERGLLWDRRDAIIEPFGETAQQVFARISAYRDSMDGDQIHDQGLVNSDPRFIYVPFHGINLIPTDIRGLTYNRSPMMNINILTIGAKDGIGGFFPKGLHGKINTPEGFDAKADGLEDWPENAPVAVQQSVEATGKILDPVFGAHKGGPVYGMEQLTQPKDGVRIDSGPDGRGMQKLPKHAEWQTTGRSVRSDIPKNDAKLMPQRQYCNGAPSGTAVCVEEGCPNDTLTARAKDTVYGAAGTVEHAVRSVTGTTVENTGQQAGDAAAQAKDGAKGYAGAAQQRANEAGQKAGDAAAQAQEGAKEYADTAQQRAQETGKKAQKGAKEYADAAQRGAQEVGQQASDTAAQAQKGAKEYAGAAQRGAQEVGQQASDTAAQVQKGAAEYAGAAQEGAKKYAGTAQQRAQEVGQQASDTAAQAQKGAKEYAGAAKEGAKEYADAAQQRARETGGKVGEGTEKVIDAAQWGAQAAGKKVEDGAKAAQKGAQQVGDQAKEKVQEYSA